jgi:hypothetical protein
MDWPRAASDAACCFGHSMQVDGDDGSIGRPVPRPRLILDPPVRMPDHPAPLPAGMPRGKRIGPDLIHIESARRLPPDDPAGALDRVRIVDAFAPMADPEHRDTAW